MTLSTNPQLELAFDFVNHTNKNIFLTGKAGTGKTTFLHQVKEKSIKRTVVVAPTGVAAINAKGMTIHSFFQLPFGPFLPGAKQDASRQRRFSKKKIVLIKSLDLLIIDEISMVRSDMLDAIDEVLRRYKNPFEPFGGVQLLMIGDLHQLPPVVKPNEWQMLQQHYQTPYFFGSLALQKTNPVTIQLDHIYRQSDSTFIDLLNRVRDNQLDTEVLDLLNSRYIDNFQPTEEEGYITLTSHNNSALSINQEKLKSLSAKSYKFTATVDGDFPPHTYPTEKVLEFKVGAQVLFVKNDISAVREYFNGKIGRITKIESDAIYVKCPEDDHTIRVTEVDWENVKFNLNEGTKEVEENVVGVFTQFPLKLAWAITIHKSQGLTFERAIIDANAAFAHGQVYVALSRCKSFEGIVLRSRIAYSSVKTDHVVKNYSKKADENKPDKNKLLQFKKEYQQILIWELFNFKFLKNILSRVERVFLENENTLTKAAAQQVKDWMKKADVLLFQVAQKFQPQLNFYFSQPELPEKNKELQDRISKASIYFLEKIEQELLLDLKKIPVVTDNQKIEKIATENLKNLTKELFVKNVCFTLSKKSFSVQKYLRAKANADLDFEKLAEKSKPASTSTTTYGIPENVPHPKLYNQFVNWRNKRAAELELKPYLVISVQSIIELTQFLPTDKSSLLRIKGIGNIKYQNFGEEIISMIEAYCKIQNIPSNLLTPVAPKKQKTDTKTKSFEMFSAGKTIYEIAAERKLVKTTIESHLGHFVATGELDIFKLLDRSKVEEIAAFYKKNPDASRADARAHFGEKYSYGELKFVMVWVGR